MSCDADRELAAARFRIDGRHELEIPAALEKPCEKPRELHRLCAQRGHPGLIKNLERRNQRARRKARTDY